MQHTSNINEGEIKPTEICHSTNFLKKENSRERKKAPRRKIHHKIPVYFIYDAIWCSVYRYSCWRSFNKWIIAILLLRALIKIVGISYFFQILLRHKRASAAAFVGSYGGGGKNDFAIFFCWMAANMCGADSKRGKHEYLRVIRYPCGCFGIDCSNKHFCNLIKRAHTWTSLPTDDKQHTNKVNEI